MTFQINPLPDTQFSELFEMTDEQLNARGAIRVTADTQPGYPCRVSLADAEIGDELILLNYKHLAGKTPYAASHAIFVKDGAKPAQQQPGVVPEVLTSRLLSVRGFDADKMMIDADIVDGVDLKDKLEAVFENPDISFVDVHYAMRGCFAAQATRA